MILDRALKQKREESIHGCLGSPGKGRQQTLPILQVTTTVLKSGEKIESDLVVVGVGAKPNIELLKGQVDMLEDKPGGVKVQFPQV